MCAIRPWHKTEGGVDALRESDNINFFRSLIVRRVMVLHAHLKRSFQVYYLNWPTRNEARFAEMGLLMVIGSKACGNWAGIGGIEGRVFVKFRILFLESKSALVFFPILYAQGWEVYCLAWAKGQLASEHAIFSSTLHFCEIHYTLGTYNFFEHLTVLTVSFWRCKDPGKK